MDVVARPAVVAGLRLVRVVGRGGEGEVWEARDERGRRRALKLVRPEMLSGEAEDRIQALLRIDHPSLVRTLRGGRLSGGGLDGWGFVEMDFVDGPSLHNAPPDPAVLERLEPLAEALDLLHAGEWSDGRPLVHRDVKPANLVQAPGGRIVLVDPSTLRALDSNTITRVGTPVFAAPEVMTGRIGPAADVYSFAATIVALLTGERGERLAGYLDHVDQLDLPDGVRRALSLHPADRPGSCLAVLEAGMQADPTVLLPAHSSELWTEGSFDEVEPAPAAPPPAPVWGWVAALVAVVATPLAAMAAGWGSDAVAVTVVGAAAGHLLACLAARTSVALAVFVPPVAWADLLARRIAHRSLRRDWARAVLTGVNLLVSAAVASSVAPDLVDMPFDPVLAPGFALALLVLVVAALQVRGFAGFVLRLLLVPLWAPGALVIVVGGLLVSPFAPTAGTAGRTLISVIEVFGGADDPIDDHDEPAYDIYG